MLTAHSKISNPKSVVRCLLTVVLKSFNITFLISLTLVLKIVKNVIFLRKSIDKRNGCVVTLRVRIYTKIYDVMGKVVNNKDESKFINTLKDIVKSARHFAYSSINLAQLRQNWLIGQSLVIQEQNGNDRAEYGKHVIEIASATLTAEYGKGFSKRNLWKFKQFYLTFKDLQIVPT